MFDCSTIDCLIENMQCQVEEIFADPSSSYATDLDIQEFLRRAAPVMEYELSLDTISALATWAPSWGEFRDVTELAYTIPDASGYDVDGPATCSQMQWSCNGALIFIATGHCNHSAWCSHSASLICWNLWRPLIQRPDSVMSLPSCATALAPHPEYPTVVAVGLFSGEVHLYDMATGASGMLNSSTALLRSSIDDFAHREPISGLQWIRLRGERHFHLQSSGADGKILYWSSPNLSAPLSANLWTFPVGGVLLRPSDAYRGFGTGSNQSSLGCSALTSSPLDSSMFVACTELGGVLNGTRPEFINPDASSSQEVKRGDFNWTADALKLCDSRKNQQLFNAIEASARLRGLKSITVADVYLSRSPAHFLYPSLKSSSHENHRGPVSCAQFSPHHRHLVMTTSVDGTALIHNIAHQNAVAILQPLNSTSGSLLSCCWSPRRPLVVAVSDDSGRVFIYDLANSTLSPATTLTIKHDALPSQQQQQSQTAPIISVSFNPNDPLLLAAADQRGRVHAWRLSSNWGEVSAAEKILLEQWTQ